MNYQNTEKNGTHFFDSSKYVLAQAKTIASKYTTDPQSLSIRLGNLPILVYFFQSLRECK